MLTSDATLRDEHIDWYHPIIEQASETAYIKQLKQEDEDAAVEQATVRVGHWSHDCQVPFVPNETGDTQVFITNKRITAENAATWVNHYA